MASQDKRPGGDFDVSLLEGLRDVITSYSIHYTKLYEARGHHQGHPPHQRDARQRRILPLGLQEAQFRRFAARVAQAVEGRRHLAQVIGDTVRLVRFRRAFDDARPRRELFNQSDLRLVGQGRQIGLRQRGGGQIGTRQRLDGVAQHRMRAGVRVLHIEHRVVLGLLGDLGQVSYNFV